MWWSEHISQEHHAIQIAPLQVIDVEDQLHSISESGQQFPQCHEGEFSELLLIGKVAAWLLGSSISDT